MKVLITGSAGLWIQSKLLLEKGITVIGIDGDDYYDIKLKEDNKMPETMITLLREICCLIPKK